MNLEELKRGIRRQYDPEYEIYEKNIELRKEIERLNKECDTYMEVATRKARRIREAIEYIENCNHGTEEYKIYEIATTEVEELLEILKGEK